MEMGKQYICCAVCTTCYRCNLYSQHVVIHEGRAAFCLDRVGLLPATCTHTLSEIYVNTCKCSIQFCRRGRDETDSRSGSPCPETMFGSIRVFHNFPFLISHVTSSVGKKSGRGRATEQSHLKGVLADKCTLACVRTLLVPVNTPHTSQFYAPEVIK